MIEKWCQLWWLACLSIAHMHTQSIIVHQLSLDVGPFQVGKRSNPVWDRHGNCKIKTRTPFGQPRSQSRTPWQPGHCSLPVLSAAVSPQSALLLSKIGIWMCVRNRRRDASRSWVKLNTTHMRFPHWKRRH
uniref:Putative secreted protein n=1 Tax=Anopheles triannulatus TaxID=58253 RepID=A0A2M4B523_9DIPT